MVCQSIRCGENIYRGLIFIEYVRYWGGRTGQRYHSIIAIF
jgi:hypothetical protein